MSPSETSPPTLIDTQCRILPLQPGDHAFLLNSWMRSYCDFLLNKTDAGRRIFHDLAYKYQRYRVERVLAKAETVVWTARASDDDDQIFGYVVATIDPVLRVGWLHYVYVKSPFRRLGIGAALLRAVQTPDVDRWFTTHHTKTFFSWRQSKPYSYHPYYWDRLVP